ncbi:MAG TPA: hypothetical protein VNW90_15605 [Acetobacteraceae bacterium]|jgi:hypothetical protein|nr:hypothetical protein [Acetobacteraceae bacterium]
MAIFVFAALMATAVIAILWGTTAVALRQPQQEHMAIEEAQAESNWSIPESGAEPDWAITPAHLRMW